MLGLNEVSVFKGDTSKIYGTQLVGPEHITSIVVTETANSFATLEMKCAISESNLQNLVVGNMIRCYKDTLQEEKYTFEIYEVKYTIDHFITIKAEHVMARLRNVYVKPMLNSAGMSIGDLSLLMGNTDGSGNYYLINKTGKLPFIITNESSSFTISCPNEIKTVSEYMAGSTGSLLDNSNGSGMWLYANDTTMDFTLYTTIDRKQHNYDLPPIRYGNNMSSFTRTVSMDAAKHAQILFWKGEDGNRGEVVVYAVKNKSGSEDFLLSNVQLIDCSNDFETKPTTSQLLAKGGTFITSPEIVTETAVAAYDGKCIVGDKLTVHFPEFGIYEEMRVVETQYNCLTRKYDKVKLGTLKKTLSKTIAEITSKTGVAVY